MPQEENGLGNLARGVRLDLAIALCALLISSVAAGASWWQARVLVKQTQELQTQTMVLQEQLGAQVWPYVSVSEGLTGNTVQVNVSNDGLGPAILRNVSAIVDGVPQSSFIGILHAMLGPNLLARSPRGDRFAFSIDSAAPGSVVRPGEHSVGFSLTSKRFSGAFLKGYRRLKFRICYCAIIPGKCWFSDSTASEPKALLACPEIPNDLLHAPALDEIMMRNF